MADILQLNSPLLNIMKALGQGGSNFLGTKAGMEDRQRQQDQEDLKSFLALMPFLQGSTQTTGPNGELFPAQPMTPPKRIQDIAQQITGMQNPVFGPSAGMRLENTKANLAERTFGDAIEQSGQATALGKEQIAGAKINNAAGQYGVDTLPIKDKQTYIAKEAGNYVANAVSAGMPATDKNRQKLVQAAYKQFMGTAPDTPYKKSVRPDDFAGAVDMAIMEEKKLAMEGARVRAYAAQVSKSGVPDYLSAAREMRMTLNNRMVDMKADKDILMIMDMQQKSPTGEIQEDALPPGILAKYRTYQGLIQQSDALMKVQSDIMTNGGVPSREGMRLLNEALNTTGADASQQASSNSPIISAFVDAIRGLPEVARNAKIATAKAEGLLTDEEIRAVNGMLKGGKK